MRRVLLVSTVMAVMSCGGGNATSHAGGDGGFGLDSATVAGGDAGGAPPIFVLDVLAMQFQEGPPGVCIYTSDPTQAYISSGILDVGLRTQYDATFLIGNELAPRGGAGQTEGAAVEIQGAIVRITDASGKLLTTFQRLGSATVQPAEQGIPSYAPINMTIIDPSTLLNDPIVRSIASAGPSAGYVRLVTYTRFFGTTLDGQSVQSNEFSFPVDVCEACLITFTNNPALPIPNCGPATNPNAPPASISCAVGEDLPTDCSLCQDQPICRGLVDAGG